jgi:hypothetical protein
MDFEPKQTSPEEQIADAVRNETYLTYAFGHDRAFQPLFENEVDPNVRTSDDFKTIKDGLGWPDQSDARKVAPPYAYESKEEFLSELFDAEETADELKQVGDEYNAKIFKKKDLNNLRLLLTVKPAEVDKDGKRMGEMDNFVLDRIGATPALLRARVVAPDLMNGLNELFAANHSFRELKELLENNDDAVAGMYMAYRIMGRLVKEDDPQRARAVDGDPVLTGRDDYTKSAHDHITR